jgi:ABC-type phosphate transport system auxiliary subunit
MLAQGYLEVDPGTAVVDQAEHIRAMLEKLSLEDRRLVIDGQKKARMQAIQEQMAELSAEDLEAMLASFEPKKAKSA